MLIAIPNEEYFFSSFFLLLLLNLFHQFYRVGATFSGPSHESDGVSAPSEPSETEMLLITQPAVLAKPLPPEMLGKGYAVWEETRFRIGSLL